MLYIDLKKETVRSLNELIERGEVFDYQESALSEKELYIECNGERCFRSYPV